MTAVPLVVLTVGTDTHPFDRAVRWLDGWAAAHPDVRVVAQWGTSSPPEHMAGGDLLPRPELDALLAEADAVVCHGGPATLAQVRAVGLLPLCVPRDPGLGEHVDDHQQRFARHQAEHGLLLHVEDEEALHGHLDRVLEEPDAFAHDPRHDAAAVVRSVARFGGYVDALLTGDDHRVETLHRDALRDGAG